MNCFYKLILLLFVSNIAFGCSHLNGYSFYFLGWDQHLEPKEETRDGNMEYFAISKEIEKGKWSFNTGGGSYIDTYDLRSYGIFSDISHDRIKWKWITPLLSLVCTYKGVDYGSDEREIKIGPLIKIRIGPDTGLFGAVTGLPPIEGQTDGFVMGVFGYKF